MLASKLVRLGVGDVAAQCRRLGTDTRAQPPSSVLKQSPKNAVLLGSRSKERGDAAKAELVAKDAAWAERIVVVQLDVTSDESVKTAMDVVKKHAPLACG